MIGPGSWPIVALARRCDRCIWRNPLLTPLPVAIDQKGIDCDNQLEPHQKGFKHFHKRLEIEVVEASGGHQFLVRLVGEWTWVPVIADLFGDPAGAVGPE